MSFHKLFLLLVLPLVISSKVSMLDKKRLQLSKPIKDCKQISCPAIEDPICVKLKYQKPELANVTTYVSMINICEMGYMKCHKDIEFFVVPMKHCDHKHVTLNKNTAKKRIKRGATKESISNIPDVPDTDEVKTFKKMGKPLAPKKSYGALLNFYNKKMNITGKKKSFRRNLVEDGGLNDENSTKHYSNIEDNTERNALKVFKPATIYGETTENVKKYDTDSDIASTNEPEKAESDSDQAVIKNIPVVSSDENKVKKKQKQDRAVNNDDDGNNDSDEHDENNDSDGDNDGDGSGDDKNDDDEDHNDVISKPAECPKSCPSRPVMVCAKCQHDVYKTFMSACHIRMFACNNEDEEIELVSRYPCIMSSAYLTSTPEMNLEPQGREDEDGDVDKVLKFIICREKGKINVDNSEEDENAGPRCNFTE